MRSRGRARAAAVATVAVFALGACGSNAPSSPASSPQHTSNTTRTSTPNSAPTSSTGLTTTPQIVQAVEHAYNVFFSSKSTTAQTEQYLQHGADFMSTLKAQGNNPMSNTSSVRASDVVLVTAHTASVRYTVLVSGQAMITNQAGFAVLENGRWKVAGQTFCALMTLQGTHPSACKDPAAIALPN